LTELFAERWPTDEATAFIEAPDGTRISYGDLRRRTAQLAHALRAHGVGPGDRVAVQIGKSPLAILLYLACVRAGAVLVPMNPAYTDHEVAYLVGDAEPALLVRDPARATTLAGAAPAAPAVPVATADSRGAGTLADAAAGQPGSFEDVVAGPDAPVTLVYTSGTTGRPKGALLSHRNLACNAATLHRVWGFEPRDVLLHALPAFHVHGLFVATNCVLANGTGMVLLPRFDAAEVRRQLARCTVLMGVPTFYTRLLADPAFDAAACRDVRLFISGSAPLPAAVHEQFRARTGHAILERYGMSETGMLTSNPLDGERRAGTVGLALPGVEVRLRDPRRGGVLDEPGAVGGIEVRGPNVFRGYWRRPGSARTEFTADGFFRTGDVGSFDADGYLTIVGRAKDVIISGGLNVYPKEVEDVLDQVDGVTESAAVGVPDPDLGEMVVAVVAVAPGPAAPGEDAIRSFARTRLAPYKVPKRVHIVGALPRNAMGKIEKARLREQLSAASPQPTGGASQQA
jgi:malonyl-CoA/methylmalonyl-CoA synthetase